MPRTVGAFSRDDIRRFLAEYGYTSNPEGLAPRFPVDYVFESEGEAHLDVSPEAVRKGNEVPDRPVRITFHKISDGAFSRWKLKSVEELAPGIETKCHDRDQGTPKVSPWPDEDTKKSE